MSKLLTVQKENQISNLRERVRDLEEEVQDYKTKFKYVYYLM